MRSKLALLSLTLPVLLLISGCKVTPAAEDKAPSVKVTPAAGDKAPSFNATLDSGKTASLESLMGEKGLILYFYPKDETPGCVTQACTFQDKLKDFEDKGYKIVGVSVDTGVSHQTFKTKHKLSFNLIADTEKTIAKLYNVPTEEDPFHTVGYRRTTFVISKDGIVRNRFEVADPKEQVNQAYSAIQQPF